MFKKLFKLNAMHRFAEMQKVYMCLAPTEVFKNCDPDCKGCLFAKKRKSMWGVSRGYEWNNRINEFTDKLLELSESDRLSVLSQIEERVKKE